MASPRERIQDPFKAWNTFVLSAVKASDVFSLFIKAALAICTVVSISLVFYSALSTQPQFTGCPKCDQVSISDQRKLTSDGVPPEIFQGKTNISHILFGIGGSAKAWNKRRHYSDFWWRPNVTRGYVWLDEKPSEKDMWPEKSLPYAVSGDTSRFKYTCWYGHRSAVRLARIVKESFELGLENVRWFVMGDDDTVFFVENLVTVLGKYDHNEMFYIGGNSESVEQDVVHSYTTAYGGGGFAISYPLAKELVRILDGCIDRYASFYGSDQKVQGCLSEIGVPITRELGFHQLDIRGDPYGLLAAHPLAPLVSLHHLDYVKPIFPELNPIFSLKKLNKPYEMDPGRTLQHSFCYDLTRNWSVSVSWGYTVQLYPSLKPAKQLETAFQTFQSWKTRRNGPFTFNTQMVSSDPCEKPVVYFLDGVESSGQEETLTRYKRYAADINQTCDQPEYKAIVAVQFVDVTASTLKPDTWNKAPRRQCCEVMTARKGKGLVQVKIRGCKSATITKL